MQLEPRQHSVIIEGETTLVSARMTQIVQMMEETNREAAEEEGEDPDDIILTSRFILTRQIYMSHLHVRCTCQMCIVFQDVCTYKLSVVC